MSEAPIARDKAAKDTRTVILIIPFGVPGSGKSTILKKLRERIESLGSADWSIDSVSSDAIRAELMAELIKQGKTKKAAFDQTGRSGPQAYGRAFGKLCSEAMGAGKAKTHIIFCDKNHPVNGLKRVNDDIRKNLAGNVQVSKLYMIPDIPQGRVGSIHGLPFSANFIC